MINLPRISDYHESVLLADSGCLQVKLESEKMHSPVSAPPVIAVFEPKKLCFSSIIYWKVKIRIFNTHHSETNFKRLYKKLSFDNTHESCSDVDDGSDSLITFGAQSGPNEEFH